MDSTPRLALVLGAAGGIGNVTARALERHGWKIRALARKDPPPDSPSTWEWVKADALDRDSVISAAKNAQAIVHGVNPPGYRNWAKLVIPMIENTIAAARASGARILLPGTIYNYGPDAFPVLREDSPQRATTRKGKIRIALEEKLESAAREGTPSLIVRFGDFFGPPPGSSWFSQAIVKPGQRPSSISYPGDRGVGHSWAYLPDTGETFAQLLDREADLSTFERFHFRGYWDADGTEMIAAIRNAVGDPRLPVRSIPWWLFRLASPFNETFREISATRHLWQAPIRLDNSKLLQFLGQEPHTPLEKAVTETLKGMRNIP